MVKRFLGARCCQRERRHVRYRPVMVAKDRLAELQAIAPVDTVLMNDGRRIRVVDWRPDLSLGQVVQVTLTGMIELPE